MAAVENKTFANLQAHLGMLLDEATASYWTSDDRKRAINASYYHLYNLAAELSDGQGLTAKAGTLALVADTATAALPADFYRMIAVYWKVGETDTRPWRPISPANQHRFRRSIPRSGKTFAYYMRASNVVMVPTPDFADTTHVIIEYVPIPTGLDADADEPDLPLGHRELLAVDAYIRLKEKEGEQAGGRIIGVRQELMKRFVEDMESRQMQESRRLVGSPDYGIYSNI